MTNEEINHLREQMGDIREDIGELRSDVKHLSMNITVIDRRIEEHQRDSLAAAVRQDASIAALSAQLAAQGSVQKAKTQRASRLWQAMIALGAGFIGAAATWFSGGGNAAP